MSEEKTNKRFRRTRETLEQDLFKAALKVISEVGFSSLTITRLIKEANADAPVFYKRYKDLDDFIDKFVRNYDYWLNDSAPIDPENKSALENGTDIMISLIDSLLSNVCMQRLLAWELNENNTTTRRTSRNRDNNSEHLTKYFEQEFKNSDIDFNVASAVVIGGIYYLILHRKRGTFNKINFNKPENIELLKSTIRAMISKMFGTPDEEVRRNTMTIARELLRNQVDVEIIARSTGLSEETIRSIAVE